MSFKRKARVAAIVNSSAPAHAAGRHRETLAILGEALKIDPNDARANLYYGWTLAHLGQPEKALHHLEKGVKGGAKDDKVWSIIGGCFAAKGDPMTAIHFALKHLRKLPHCINTLSELGTYFMTAQNPMEAQKALRKSIALDPAYYGALNNLGLIHKDFADTEMVSRLCLRSLAIKGTVDGVAKNYISSFLYWGKVPHAQFEAAKSMWVRRFSPIGASLFRHARRDPDPDRRLRVGVVSSDLKNHPVGRNFLPIFARAKSFDWRIYANSIVDDDVQKCYLGKGAVFTRINAMTDQEVADLIDRDRCDVVLFLACRMDDNRPQVAAFQAAPVQISYLDVGSANMPGINYTILAPEMAPRGRGGERIDERVMRVPRFYQHPEGSPVPVQAPPFTRGHPFTFGSFNNSAKLNTDVLRSWARILEATPGSRLLLKYKHHFMNPTMQAHVCKYLPRDRVMFAGMDNVQDIHYGTFNAIDLCLDPFSFNGSTTTFDSLWMGIPVVTFASDVIMGRYGAAIMRQVRLPEFAHTTLESYEAHAVALARDPTPLVAIRADLRAKVLQHICTPKAYYVERAIRATWRKWCREERDRPEVVPIAVAAGVSDARISRLERRLGQRHLPVAGLPAHVIYR